MTKVTLEIDDALYAFASEQAKECQLENADVYLAMTLKMALEQDRQEFEEWRRKKIFPLNVLMDVREDEGGAAIHDDDDDDGIPF